MRAKLLKLSELPRWTRSSIANADPNRDVPKKESELPTRPKVRTESELPRCKKSRIERAKTEPKRHKPCIETPEPNLAKLRRLIELPS
jgi:hypothetical protein